MKTLNVRMDEPTVEELEMDGEVVPKEKKETKKLEPKSKLPSWFMPFIIGMLIMGGIATMAYNSHYKKYNQAISLMEDQLSDQDRFQRNNSIIQRAINDNKKIVDSMSGRTIEMQKAVGEVLRPKTVSIH